MNHESGSAGERVSGSAGERVGELRITNDESHPSRFTFHASRLLPTLLLLVFFALGMAQVRRASITFDEGPHLAIGYATLRTGDFRLQPVHIHPPLANVLAAAPLLLQNDLPDPRAVDGWEIASLSAITDAIVWQYPHPARLAVAGRTPMLLLGVLLGALVYRWARDLAGHKAGLLALTLYALDPNLIAHSALITTDAAAVFFIVATLYALKRVTSFKLVSALRYSLRLTSRRPPLNPPQRGGMRAIESFFPPLGGIKGGNLLKYAETNYGEYFMTVTKFQVAGYGAVGVLLGLAQLAKVSALLLVPVVGLIVFVEAFYRAQSANSKLQIANSKGHFALCPLLFAIRHSLLVFLPAALVLWAGYRFQILSVPGWPFPIPAGTHFLIFQSLYAHYNLGHPTFALGQVSTHGWPWYFPFAFLIKTPLPTLLLGLGAVVRSCKLQVESYKLEVESRKSKVESRELGVASSRVQVTSFRFPISRFKFHVSSFTFHVSRFISKIQNPKSKIQNPAFLCLWLFPCLYLASSLFSSVNIGYRHLLPFLPFLYIGIGAGARHEWSANTRMGKSESAGERVGELRMTNHESRLSRFTFHVSRFTLHALLLWLAVSAFRTLPYPLTFFNELAGGARNGYRYLVDSNLDWGQNLWDLQRWLADNGESHVFYAHYSPARPQTYGIDADFLPPDPRAVNFAPWHPAPGLYAIGATVLQGPYCPDLNTYAWFRAHEPETRLGHALFVYRVPDRPAPAWVALCNQSGVGADALAANLGADVERVLWLDCTNVQVYPTAGAPGLYVTRAGIPPLAGALDAALRDDAGRGTVAVYRVETAPSPQVALPGAQFDGPLDFVGYTLPDATTLWTYWRVREIPDRPLSLMAHLIAPDGTAAAVGDGLSFPVEQWRPGDLIAQRHDFGSAPPGAISGYSLQIGAYWLDTMERWPVSRAGGQITDSLLLPLEETPSP